MKLLTQTLWRKRLKLNNRGSAIVTVIVVTIFITLIATTMLFVSSRNYIMKQTDYQNTRSFYTAEETLDKLKELLVTEVDVGFDVAYRDMMRNYTKYTTSDQRLRYYVDSFTTELDDRWADKLALSGTPLETVRKFMEDKGVSTDMTKLITNVGGFEIVSIDNKNRFVIKGVEVYYVDDHGFSSYITTDIALSPPEYDVDATSDKVNMSEYVIYVNWKKY